MYCCCIASMEAEWKELVIDRYVAAFDKGAKPTKALLDSFAEKRKVTDLFYGLGKKDEDLQGVFNRDWVKEQFSELLDVPRYTFMKTIEGDDSLRDYVNTDPLIYGGKVYRCDGYTMDIEDCSDGSLITTLILPSRVRECIINDGKMYGIYNSDIRDGGFIMVLDCSDDSLLTPVAGPRNTYISNLHFHAGKLYASCGDHTIQVYDCSDHSLITTLKHTGRVTCLAFYSDKLYSSMNERKDSDPAFRILVWNLSTHRLITTLEHIGHIRELQIYDGKLYAANDCGVMMVWDCSNDKLLDTQDAGWSKFTSFHEGKLYYVTHNRTIRVYDCGDLSLTATLEWDHGAQEYTTLCHAIFHDDKLYCSSYSATSSSVDMEWVCEIKVWDCSDYSLLTTILINTGHYNLDAWPGYVVLTPLMFIHKGKLYCTYEVWPDTDYYVTKIYKL